MIPFLSMLSQLWTYRTHILAAIAGAVVGFKAGMMVGHHTGVNDGRETLQNEIMAQSMSTREKLNEILDNRPDTIALVKRLRDGKF